MTPISFNLPEKFQPLFMPARYKAFWGGRGSAKSHSFADALLAETMTSWQRVLCTREYQNSIKDSVHRLLTDKINDKGLAPWFTITEQAIRNRVTGAEYLFKGLHRNIQEIKSLEGVTRVWCEEAQSMTEDSWRYLTPTIRAPNSEIWLSFNPDQESDPTYQRCVKSRLPDMVSVEVNYSDNPWFPAVLEMEREHEWRLANETGDWDAYNWIWRGQCRKISDAVIFRRRVHIHTFDTPLGTTFYHGADFGFANDPNAIIRCWIDHQTNELYIDREAYGYHIEIDELPALWRTIDTGKRWPIIADNARPETISYMARQGFNVTAADKWPGSVEDGIAHLKGFAKIHIHESECPHMADEARLYKWKVDRTTNEILPVPVDRHNHCWDALRYALGNFIQARGALGVWAKLAS